jgi:uncharacterized protein involved in exopolysaccharide biosynthesis
MGEYFVSGSLLRLVVKWKFHLAAILIVAALASTIFSSEWFIKPRYKSNAVVYPSNLPPYGSETPTEQMLQLLQSNDIRNNIIKKYDLARHYNVDTTKPGGKALLMAEFEENITVRKTEYESVKIDVWDVNPDTAARIAQDMITFLDLKARSLQRAKTMEVLNLHKGQLEIKEAEKDTLEAQLKELRVKYGLLDYEAQAKEITKRYLEAVRSGNKASIAEVDVMMRNLEEKGGEFIALEDQLKKTRKTYNEIKMDYENAQKDLAKEFSYSNIVVRPVPADKKSYPVRWIIVSAFTSSTFLLSLIILAFIDSRTLPKIKKDVKSEIYELQEEEVN